MQSIRRLITASSLGRRWWWAVWLVGTARCAVPGGKAAGRDGPNADFTTFVAPAIRARTAQRAVPTKLARAFHMTLPSLSQPSVPPPPSGAQALVEFVPAVMQR